jgi:hypothetical protein
MDVLARPAGAERDEAIHAWSADVWAAFRDNHSPLLISGLRMDADSVALKRMNQENRNRGKGISEMDPSREAVRSAGARSIKAAKSGSVLCSCFPDSLNLRLRHKRLN